MNKIIVAVAVLLVVVIGGFYALNSYIYDEKQDDGARGPTADPLDATFVIDGAVVTLVDSVGEIEVAPGSASKQTVRVFDEPVYGDIDGDYDDDAALFLTSDSGGSGTFYYIAPAMLTSEGFVGGEGILLGDRIAPQNIEIKNGILIANYANRNPNEPMTTAPSVGMSKYATYYDDVFKEVPQPQVGEQLLFGYLTIGHEVRTFRECGEGQPEMWLSGDSPVYEELTKRYAEEVEDVEPSTYAPLFAVVVGSIGDAPEDGFGADYEHGIRVSQLVRADREESCKADVIVVTSPLAGETIGSSITVTGYARGSWFFEADFPLILTDWDGRIIAEGYASARGDWMTKSYVPFAGELEFEKPALINGFSKRGFLIFKKANASGLPEHDDALEYSVYFE